MSGNPGDLVAVAFVVLVLAGLWAIGHRAGRRPPAPKPRRRARRWRWFIWFCGITLLAMSTAFAQDAPQQAYVTANHANAAWLGLATQDGRYAIQLGDGCDGVVEGVNVLVTNDGERLPLQVIDPSQGVLESVCSIANIVRTGETSCATNPDGVRDYGYS